MFALVACTGLLIGNFNRRGQIKIVSLSVSAAVILQALDLALGNLAVKHLSWLAVMYLNLLLPFVGCLFLLRVYSPSMLRRKNPRQGEADV